MEDGIGKFEEKRSGLCAISAIAPICKNMKLEWDELILGTSFVGMIYRFPASFKYVSNEMRQMS